MALGAGNVTPMQMVVGYSVFANGGFHIPPYFIERIEDFDSQYFDLGFDVTGPWPPYDFVRVVV